MRRQVSIILDFLPGRFALQASKAGFQVALLPEFTLEVDQTSTYDFTLKPQSIVQSVTVQAQGTRLQKSPRRGEPSERISSSSTETQNMLRVRRTHKRQEAWVAREPTEALRT